MKHSEYLKTSFVFGHLAANVRVRCSVFQSYVSMLYIRIDVRHLCLAHCKILADFEENVEEMVGMTREAAAVVTESGGAATTGDETAATAGDEMAAIGGVMYTDEGS